MEDKIDNGSATLRQLLLNPGLSDPENPARSKALDLLRTLAANEAEALIAHTLESSSERERSLLCLSLGVLGSALASRPLVALLGSSESERVRMASAWALIHVGSASALEGLVSLLTDPSERLVRLACVALARITAEQVIRPLTSLLDHDLWRIGLQSAVALMYLSVKETRILSTLTDLASSPDAAIHDSMVDDLELIEMMFPVLKGDNESKSRLKLNDLIEEARKLVD